MRSAWLANFLTYGKTYCHHDIFAKVETMAGFQLAMDWDYEAVGVADPSLVFFWEEVSKLYQDATWIVIERPFRETLESCKKAFGGFDENNLHVMKARLEKLKYRLKPHLFNFENLEFNRIACLCDTPIPFDRVMLLKDMQVQLEPKYLLTKIKELQDNPTPLMRNAA